MRTERWARTRPTVRMNSTLREAVLFVNSRESLPSATSAVLLNRCRSLNLAPAPKAPISGGWHSAIGKGVGHILPAPLWAPPDFLRILPSEPQGPLEGMGRSGPAGWGY